VKILVLAQVFPPRRGGSGQWLWELYRRLRADVHVVAGATDGDTAFDRESTLSTERMALDFHSWGVTSMRAAAQYIRTFARVRRATSRIRADVIHCGKSLPEGLIGAAISLTSGVPFLIYVHGEELTLAAASRELRWLTRIVLRRAHAIVANSHHTKKLLVDSWSAVPDKIDVLHPGVDTARFVPAATDAAVRRRLGWTGRRVILTVGALQKRKGQDMMIRALPAIRSRCPDVLYAIAGEGWERSYLESLAQSCGVNDAVQFRGAPAETELIESYQQCDVFALPNRQVGWDFEGFGIVLLEAQACGKAVVAGRSGGTPETMQMGTTGELVDCEAPEPLAEIVAGLLCAPDQLAEMGARARDWAVARFDWTVRAREAEEHLGKVAQLGRGIERHR
jgi:phosphatidyl-myo-inositol dimannoside synthase